MVWVGEEARAVGCRRKVACEGTGVEGAVGEEEMVGKGGGTVAAETVAVAVAVAVAVKAKVKMTVLRRR
jgi:hypothetical protein